mmetsp:Transcript_38243/g.121525  ORF Transcript_38243/g.121525 Transcript_38243/m.121525 type:complete len:208 (+) Transcript_38243:415-1038(+)
MRPSHKTAARPAAAALAGGPPRTSRRPKLVASAMTRSVHHQSGPLKIPSGLGLAAARCSERSATSSSSNVSHQRPRARFVASTATSTAHHHARPLRHGKRRRARRSNKPKASSVACAVKSTVAGCNERQPRQRMTASMPSAMWSGPSSGFTRRWRCRQAKRPTSTTASTGAQKRKTAKSATSLTQAPTEYHSSSRAKGAKAPAATGK